MRDAAYRGVQQLPATTLVMASWEDFLHVAIVVQYNRREAWHLLRSVAVKYLLRNVVRRAFFLTDAAVDFSRHRKKRPIT
jgi:hypothetical protein